MKEIISKDCAVSKGLTHYFTGKECKHGHLCDRYVKTNQCFECASEFRKKWRANNPERTNELHRNWRKNNPEREKESHIKSNKKWWDNVKDQVNEERRILYHENIDESRAKCRIESKKYRETHKDTYTIPVKNWRKRHPERARELGRQIDIKWRTNNPEEYKAKNARKRLNRLAPGSHTGEDIKFIYKLQHGKCAYCKESLEDSYHVDHIIPICLGGSNDKSNIQITCPSCNLSKGPKDPIVYAQSLGMLL